MSDPIIRVQNLSKRYRIGSSQASYQTFREVITGMATVPFRRLRSTVERWKVGRSEPSNPQTSKPSNDMIWALKDVSFEVAPGEVVGIIGRNGAGKSTLLKILSRITEPTEGRVELHGRLASLLEVGTGFHPELTGRENIFLNGAILGMKRVEIGSKFDEIVAFAEIERFLDTPVKRYSSGMYVRLAFAVAAHLEPEILLVDEVLAVGDAAFQKKCLGKMGEVAKEGRTVLFVSHNMTAVKSLCRDGILLNAGAVSCTGGINQVVNTYLSTDRSKVMEQNWDSIESAPGNNMVRVKRVKLMPVGEIEDDHLTVKTPFQVHFELWVLVPATLNLSMHVKSISSETIFAVPSPQVDCGPGIAQFTCDVPGDFMNDGVYSIMMMIVKDSIALFVLDDAVIFEVHDVERTGNWLGRWPGAIRPKLGWEHEVMPLGYGSSE